MDNIQNGKHCVSADHGCDFNSLAYQITKLRNFTKGENFEILIFILLNA